MHPDIIAVFLSHPRNQLIPAFVCVQRRHNGIRELRPQHLVILIIQVGAVMKDCFIFLFGPANQIVIKLVGPDQRKTFIQQMFAHTDLQQTHQCVILIIGSHSLLTSALSSTHSFLFCHHQIPP